MSEHVLVQTEAPVKLKCIICNTMHYHCLCSGQNIICYGVCYVYYFLYSCRQLQDSVTIISLFIFNINAYVLPP